MYNPNTNFGNGFFAMRKLIAVTSLILIAFLSGCASVPMAAVENDTARKSFPSPSPDTAGLYIYRNTSFGGAHKKDIFIDGERVAESAPMTYFYFEVEEGIRKLSTESEFSPNDLIVDVEKGNNYFVRQSIKMGVFAAGADLELVSDEEGKKGVLQCKLASNINGNVLIYSGGINTPVLAAQTSPEGEISVFDYYGQAEEEINTQTYDKNLWAKALVETEGDQTKRKAKYIELRANQLYIEKVGSVSDTSLGQQATPIKPDTPGTQIDLTGTYRSKITGSYRSTSPVQIVQDENKITGISADKYWEIEGVLEGNTMGFVWYGPSNKGKGKFFVDSRGNLTGVYIGDSWGEGKWNLTKSQ